jgi:cell wall-associated NlpC family hydrolase
MFRGTIVRGRVTMPIACYVLTIMLPFTATTAGAVSSVASQDGDVALYQDATQDPSPPDATTGDGVEPATADSPAADVEAPEQEIASTSTEAGVDPAPVEVSTDTTSKEALADPSGAADSPTGAGTDPAPVALAAPASEVDSTSGQWVDPATEKDGAPGTASAIPVAPAPPDAPAPQNAPSTRGPEPWGEPIATAYIAGTGGDGAPCLTAPDWGAATLTVLGEGEAVPVRAETRGEWQPVDCAGAGGYVHVALITWTPVAPSDPVTSSGELPKGKTSGNGEAVGEQIVSFAMQFQGYPYVYAGEGPYAFDCSGFTMFVIHNTLGINIPHDMRVQYQMGRSVSRDELQPGDEVFFANTLNPGMSHTGIYIGNGQFIHAETESSGVRISDLDAEYYSSRWYGAVRFG